MKKSEWLDCQRNEFFPKQKGIPSLVKIEHKNTATLDSARSKKKSKVAVLQLHNVGLELSPFYKQILATVTGLGRLLSTGPKGRQKEPHIKEYKGSMLHRAKDNLGYLRI